MTTHDTPEAALAAAVAGVYDAHGTPAERRIPIAGQITYRSRAKIVADLHAQHDGEWAAGSCDAELFALEWEIFLAEHPTPRPGILARLRATFSGVRP